MVLVLRWDFPLQALGAYRAVQPHVGENTAGKTIVNSFAGFAPLATVPSSESKGNQNGSEFVGTQDCLYVHYKCRCLINYQASTLLPRCWLKCTS